MNPIEKQILENQRRIMDFLLNPHNSVSKHDLIVSINNTAKLFKSRDKEDCCDMSEEECVKEEKKDE